MQTATPTASQVADTGSAPSANAEKPVISDSASAPVVENAAPSAHFNNGTDASPVKSKKPCASTGFISKSAMGGAMPTGSGYYKRH